MPWLPHSSDLFAAKEADSWLKLTQDLGNRSYVEEIIGIFNVIYSKVNNKWRRLLPDLKILKEEKVGLLSLTDLISVRKV